MRLRSRLIFVPIGILVIILAVGLARGSKDSSSSPTVAPTDVHLVSGGATSATAATATPDALSAYAAGIRHDRSVLSGVFAQFGTDVDGYNAGKPGSFQSASADNDLIGQTVADAERLAPPPGSDTLFISMTQALDALKTISDNLGLDISPLMQTFQENLRGMSAHATENLYTNEFADARAKFTAQLGALDTLIAKLPAAASSTPSGTLDQQMEKSIRDNKYAAGDYTFDHLTVNYTPFTKALVVSVNPDEPEDTALLTDASELDIISGAAIWSTYPQVQTITVDIFQPKHDSAVIWNTYTRATGSALPYLHLKSQPADDNKVMLCGADHFLVATYIWAQLEDKGCMTSPSK